MANQGKARALAIGWRVFIYCQSRKTERTNIGNGEVAKEATAAAERAATFAAVAASM
jgi:hypothetical protein